MKIKRYLPLITLVAIMTFAPKATSQQLVWSEDFNYTGLPDSSDWYYDVGGHGWGNNELQYYTSERAENTRVENGKLIIQAHQENYEGSTFTSGRLLSKGTWLYGRFEVRAKLPYAVGTWPAIWMLPTDWAYGGWPGSGEIDIMEHVGFDFGNVHASTHSENYNFKTGGNPTGSIYASDVSSNFHTYACEWHPDRIDFFFDDQLYFTSYNDGTGWQSWPFDKDFHFVLNIAVGGDWGGVNGIDYGAFPQQMEIDYIRVYDLGYATNDTVAPNVATNLSATTGPRFGTLSWDHATDNVGVEDYIIYLDGQAIDTTATSSISVNNLTEATNYQFSVQTRDVASNLSAISPAIGFTTSVIVPQTIPGRIEAESFVDFSGIQLEDCTDPNSGNANDQNVGWVDDGDWMEYHLDVPTTGEYHMYLRVASADPEAGALQILDENDLLLATVDVQATGGWQTWETISLPLTLGTGEKTLKLVAVTGGFNLNWFELNTIPIGFNVQIEAEDYIDMLGVQTESTTDAGGGQNVGWLDNGDWMSYNINLPASGTYLIEYRVASAAATGQLVLSQNSTDIEVTDVPNTGGWQNWTTVSTTAELDNSNSSYVIYVNSGPFNINWFRITYQAPDFEAPSPVSNLIANASTTSVQLNWDAATDNVGVTGYEIFVDGIFEASTSALSFEVTGLSSSTTYEFDLFALDAANNKSVVSSTTAMTSAMTHYIEAESYASMWGVGVESTTDINGGQNVGWIDNGDWMSYNVNIPVSGTYEIQYRIASPNSTGQIIFSQNSSDLQTTNVPNTGWWQNWQTISTTVDLQAGPQNYALYASSGGFNINWWSFELINSATGSRAASNQVKSSIQETPIEEQSRFLIYPNPVADQLQIQHTGQNADTYVSILNLAGQLQMKPTLISGHTNIDVSRLKPGIYFIHLRENDTVQIKRMIKH
ncbi:MAG: carbohydrate-binding protein [Cytophagales bacterium]|nr:carbohydrate-binding protein [Cytophagales bacterium]